MLSKISALLLTICLLLLSLHPAQAMVDSVADKNQYNYSLDAARKQHAATFDLGKKLKDSMQTFDVFSGAATYTIPVALPAGRAGVQPNLALHYTSQNTQVDGVLGRGWNASGVPSVYRTPLRGVDRLYTEGGFATDMSGGGDLVEVSPGVYGARTESTYTEYTLEDGVFTARDRAGMRYTFAEVQSDPEDTSRVFRWMLTRMEDLKGNFLTVTYTHDGGQVYADEIRYTGFGSDAGVYQVRFVYEASGWSMASYRTNFPVVSAKRLHALEIVVGGVVRQTVTMTYTGMLLTEVMLTGGGESSSLGAFTYYDGTEHAGRVLHMLKTVTLPAGGVVTYAYSPTTAQRLAEGGSAHPAMPFVVQTVSRITRQACPECAEEVTEYAYEGGHYYIDSTDVFRREYAGFRKVITTSATGNTVTSFFHQSERAALPENLESDHIVLKGREYLTEIRNSAGELLTVVRKVDAYNDLGDGRFFPYEAAEISFAYEGGVLPKARAITYTYDTEGNMTESTDYGEVTASDTSGVYMDIGADTVRTLLTYAKNTTAHILGVPAEMRVEDGLGGVQSESRTYYDGLGIGQVSLGNVTSHEQRISTGTYATTHATYTVEGLPLTQTDARGYTTTYAYDAARLFPIRVINPLSQETAYTYDYLSGTPLTQTDANGLMKETVLDGLSRVVEMRSMGEVTTEITYQMEARPAQVTMTLPYDATTSSTITLCMDGFLRTRETRQSQNASQAMVVAEDYDTEGRVAKKTLPFLDAGMACTGADTEGKVGNTYTYDALGRVLTDASPLGETTYAYMPWAVTTTNTLGNAITHTTDAWGNLIRVDEMPDGMPQVTTYEYNPLQKMTRITDALGNTRALTYDALGRMTAEEDLHAPSAAPVVHTYAYDAAGNIITKSDPRGFTTTYDYDSLNRPLYEDTSATPDRETEYTYDTAPYGITRLASARTAATLSAYTYDIRGNTLSETLTVDGTTYTTSYGYNRLGMQTTVTLPGGITFDIAYDASGLPSIVSYGTTLLATVTGRAAHAAPATLVYGNGVTRTDTYDPAQNLYLTARMTDAAAVRIQDLAYEYDGVGNITRVAESAVGANAGAWDYAYDALGRLVGAAITAGGTTETQAFTYNPIGNITSTTESGAYTYAGVHPHAVTSMGGVSFTYDAAGNMQTKDGWNLEYDYRNRLIGAVRSGDTLAFQYDHTGRRVMKHHNESGRKTVYVNRYMEVVNGEKQYYAFLGGERVATLSEVAEYPACDIPIATAESPATWTPTVSCVYNGSGVMHIPYTTTVLPVGAEVLAAEGDAVLIRLTTPTLRTIYHHTDHLTGASVETDAAGAVVQSLSYHPYGSERVDDRAGRYRSIHTYTDKEKDIDTGLFDYGARYYDPTAKRFLSLDPWAGDIRNPQTLNEYSYVVNNPIRYIDPTGEKVEVVARALNKEYVGDLGVHTFLRITPDNPGDFGMPENSYFTLGAYNKDGKLVGGINDASDIGIPAKGEKMSGVVATPDGMTDTQFITAILEVYGRADNNQDYSAFSINAFGQNCNNFTASLIEEAGGELPDNFSPGGANPGLGETIPEMMDSAHNGRKTQQDKRSEQQKQLEEQKKYLGTI